MRESLYPHPTWIEVDLGQFKKNLSIIRDRIGQSRLCLVVKGNAYGHGICRMGREALDAGVDSLAVSCLQEGVSLRKSGVQIPILVMGAIHEDQIDDLVAFQLEFTISSQFKADLVAKRGPKKCRVHIEIDTGMQRTGVRASSAGPLFDHLRKLGCFDVVGIYSHLATAELPNDGTAKKQIESFKNLLKNPIFQGHPLLSHIANSNGVIHYPESYLDMVRPGIMAYGYLPTHAPPSLKGIAPCFSLKSKVSYFKVVERGEGIGYGHTYVTTRQTRIVTVPVGYGDGYLRSLSNRGSVLIRGKRFPIAGMICMDQFMVDVGTNEVYVGDEVVLIGKQGDEEITLQEIASACQTIPYEVLCLLNERIPRYYTAI